MEAERFLEAYSGTISAKFWTGTTSGKHTTDRVWAVRTPQIGRSVVRGRARNLCVPGFSRIIAGSAGAMGALFIVWRKTAKKRMVAKPATQFAGNCAFPVCHGAGGRRRCMATKGCERLIPLRMLVPGQHRPVECLRATRVRRLWWPIRPPPQSERHALRGISSSRCSTGTQLAPCSCQSLSYSSFSRHSSKGGESAYAGRSACTDLCGEGDP